GLAGAQDLVAVDAVPADEIRDGDTEAIRDQVERIAGANGVAKLAGGAVAGGSRGRRGVLAVGPDHQLLADREGVARRHAVPRGEFAHAHAVAAADAPEALAGRNPVFHPFALALAVPGPGETGVRALAVLGERLRGHRYRQVGAGADRVAAEVVRVLDCRHGRAVLGRDFRQRLPGPDLVPLPAHPLVRR